MPNKLKQSLLYKRTRLLLRTLVPQPIVGLDSLLLAMLIVQMSITKDIHGVLQAIIIVEKLKTA